MLSTGWGDSSDSCGCFTIMILCAIGSLTVIGGALGAIWWLCHHVHIY